MIKFFNYLKLLLVCVLIYMFGFNNNDLDPISPSPMVIIDVDPNDLLELEQAQAIDIDIDQNYQGLITDDSETNHNQDLKLIKSLLSNQDLNSDDYQIVMARSKSLIGWRYCLLGIGAYSGIGFVLWSELIKLDRVFYVVMGSSYFTMCMISSISKNDFFNQ